MLWHDFVISEKSVKLSDYTEVSVICLHTFYTVVKLSNWFFVIKIVLAGALEISRCPGWAVKPTVPTCISSILQYHNCKSNPLESNPVTWLYSLIYSFRKRNDSRELQNKLRLTVSKQGRWDTKQLWMHPSPRIYFISIHTKYLFGKLLSLLYL